MTDQNRNDRYHWSGIDPQETRSAQFEAQKNLTNPKKDTHTDGSSETVPEKTQTSFQVPPVMKNTGAGGIEASEVVNEDGEQISGQQLKRSS